MYRRHAVAALLALLSAAAIGPAVAADAAPGRAEVEAWVRELLEREPELVLDALQEIQRRREVEAAELKRELIAEEADRLLADPASPVAGNRDGDVTLVEFFDYQCGYCRRMVPVMQALLREDDGVRIVFKELPILGPESVEASRAALASARQGRFLDFHFALMASDDLSPEGIRETAEAVGLDADRLRADMDDPAITMQINANYALARELGIEGTPAMVIGREFVPGAVGEDRLRELIAQARTDCATTTC
jgi:protein-disulfide isomerase